MLCGVKEAAALNTIATVAKILPIAIFIFTLIAGFRADIFALNFWGGESMSFSGVASYSKSQLKQQPPTNLVGCAVRTNNNGAYNAPYKITAVSNEN